MPVVYDRVQETSVTLGTGTYTLAGAVAGYRTFAAACSTGDVVPYVAVDTATSDWEIGLGTYSAGTLSRTTIRRSSNANAAVSWVSGTRQVFIDATAADALASLITSAIGAGTAGQVLTSSGSSANPVYADMAFGAPISGRYFSSASSSVNNTGNFTNGTLYYFPLPVWRGLTISDIGIALSNSAFLVSGSKARIGIYSHTTTGPGSLLLDAGETTNLSFSTAPTFNGLAISGNYTFPRPGLYWLAVTFNQSVFTTNGGIYNLLNTTYTNNSASIFGGSLNSIFAVSSQAVHGCSEAFTYAALPSTASTTPTFGAVAYPFIVVKVA